MAAFWTSLLFTPFWFALHGYQMLSSLASKTIRMYWSRVAQVALDQYFTVSINTAYVVDYDDL